MKIRWTKNSVRFRITPSELGALQRDETIHESFPLKASWNAAIAPSFGATELQFMDGELKMLLSKSDLDALSNPQNEGVYFQMDSAESIRYFIEKDFPCANPRAPEAAEPITETFLPPSNFEKRKAK